MPGASHRPVIVLLMAGVLIAGCGSTSASPSPASSPAPLPAPTSSTEVPGSTAGPALLPTPTPGPGDPLLGQVVVTVSDNLRVRSQPRVADDSVKYTPLLPIYTELRVLDGPVKGSGYTWYKVEPVGFSLYDGPGQGWVAMAAKDGEPWIALVGAPIAGIELAKASVQRATADPAAAKTAAASINAFGLDLYRTMLADPALSLAEKNVVFSPTSIALALAMARAGAKGDTAAQMDAVLHTTGWDALGPGLNALEQALASRNATWQEEEWLEGYEDAVKVTRELTLRIANAALAQRAWALEQAYLDRIASTFDAGVRLVDFAADPDAARRLINAWVSQQTKHRIPGLLQPPDVTEDTRLGLVNAVYLKANWDREFELDRTESASFTRLDRSKVSVPTMWVMGEQDIPYARGTGWQATELRYRGAFDPENGHAKPLAMTLILPDDLAAFEQRLTAAQIQRISATLEGQRQRLEEGIEDRESERCQCGCYAYAVEVFMPRFGIETRVPLADELKAMGMATAFDPEHADFTGIHVPADEMDRPFISTVIHQANIDVDEKGTEAAAATYVGQDTGGCTGPVPAKVITLKLDRPFLFVLRDVETGAVLFMGRVVDPSIGR